MQVHFCASPLAISKRYDLDCESMLGLDVDRQPTLHTKTWKAHTGPRCDVDLNIATATRHSGSNPSRATDLNVYGGKSQVIDYAGERSAEEL